MVVGVEVARALNVMRHRICDREARHRDIFSQRQQRRNVMQFVTLWACAIGLMIMSVIPVPLPAQLVVAEAKKK